MKYLFLLLLTCSCVHLLAQKQKELKEYFLLYDKDGNPVKEFNVAATFKAITIENDSTYVVRYYENNGPMIWRQTFKDAKLTIPNGWFAWYDENGNIKTSGNMVNGKKDGYWATYDGTEKDSILKMDFFKMGISSKNEYKKDDKVDTTGQKPAAYRKGVKGWQAYLKHHLNTKVGIDIPVYKKLTNNQALVVVTFLICTDGSVKETYIRNSKGYPFDKEVLRVINASSGDWIPAFQSGRNVTYRQQQRIIFQAIRL